MSNLAIVQDGFNLADPLSTLKLVAKRVPMPAPGQVVVRVKLRTIQLFDLITMRGTGIANGTTGCEGYGILHEVGEGVTTLRKGQRVVPIISVAMTEGNGSWQEHVCLDVEYVWPLTDAITDEQGAQFVINPWTAYSMLEELSADMPKSSEYLVQSAAGSTLGKQVIALARHMGIEVINVVRRAEQMAELEALGEDAVICSVDEDADVGARVRKITGGKGAWAAMTQTLASCTRDNGQIFVYGMLGGPAETINVVDLWRNVQLASSRLWKILWDREKREACAAEVAALMVQGAISVAEVQTFDLKDFKLAMARMEEVGSAPKISLSSA